MGTTSLPKFREITIRPNEHPEVSVEPDGSIEVLFREEGLTVLLSPDEAQRLAGSLQSAVVFGGIG